MPSSDFIQRQQQNLKRRSGPSNPETPAGVTGLVGSGSLHSTSTDTITLLGPPTGHTYTINVVNDPPLGFSEGTRIRITEDTNVAIWAEGPITLIEPGVDSGHVKFTIVSDRENIGGTSSNWRVAVAMPHRVQPVIRFSDSRNPSPGDGNDGDVWIRVDAGSNSLIFELKKFGVWENQITFTAPSVSSGGGGDSSSGGDSGGDGGGGE